MIIHISTHVNSIPPFNTKLHGRLNVADTYFYFLFSTCRQSQYFDLMPRLFVILNIDHYDSGSASLCNKNKFTLYQRPQYLSATFPLT